MTSLLRIDGYLVSLSDAKAIRSRKRKEFMFLIASAAFALGVFVGLMA